MFGLHAAFAAFVGLAILAVLGRVLVAAICCLPQAGSTALAEAIATFSADALCITSGKTGHATDDTSRGSREAVLEHCGDCTLVKTSALPPKAEPPVQAIVRAPDALPLPEWTISRSLHFGPGRIRSRAPPALA
ncbi:MAG: DUF2946 family protein [Ilumatobacteraceae bacterium]